MRHPSGRQNPTAAGVAVWLVGYALCALGGGREPRPTRLPA
jgi:hypothetical protein